MSDQNEITAERLLSDARWLEQVVFAQRRIAAAGSALTMFAKMLRNPVTSSGASAIQARTASEASLALQRLAAIEKAMQREISEVRDKLLAISCTPSVPCDNQKPGSDSAAPAAISNVPTNPFDRLLPGPARPRPPH